MLALAVSRAAPAISLVSVDDEIAIGREAQAQISRQTPQVTDRVVTSYVERLGRALASRASGPEYPYSFDVANYREVNAFALPGGPVWVHRGAIDLAGNESQLAGVLAHEVAHIAERHAADQLTKAVLANFGLGLLGALLGNSGGANAAQIAARLAAGGAFLKFSRDDEREADRVGAELMHRAGWDARGMLEFMQALESQALTWVRPDNLPEHDLLEADRAIVTALRLPRLARVLSPGETLHSVRGRAAQTILIPVPEEGGGEIDGEAVAAARAAGHRVLVMGADVEAVRVAALARCDGVLLRWLGQSLHVDRSGAFLVGVHCVDAQGAKEAVAEGAHFLVIGPEDGSLSERLLERLCAMVGRPVFAGWYPDARRLERLQQLGAHGCAVGVPGRTYRT